MRGMKIAVFVEYLPPKLGSDRRIFEIMKRISPKYEIHFIVLPPIRILSGRIQGNEDIDHLRLQKKTATEKYAGITGHFVSLPPRIAAIWRHSFLAAAILSLPWLLKDVTRTLVKVRPDIVVLNYPSPYTGLLGLAMGKLLRRPVVLDFNDLIAQYTIELFNLKKSSFKAKLLVLAQQHIARSSQKVTAPTHFVRNYAVSLGVRERDLAIIPNGVDTNEFNPHRFVRANSEASSGTLSERSCYYHGRLDEWAGLTIVSRLCDLSMKKRLNVKFVLVGSGVSSAFCKQNAAFHGEVPHEEIPLLLASADVILVPFPNNDVSHAASPLKLFEGMAMQKPVIASRVSGVEEVITDGENGFLADPENINEWVEKLQTALTPGTFAAKISWKARRTVEDRYDWRYLANRFEKVLDAAMLEHQRMQRMN